MPSRVLCGGVSRANCARNSPGPLMVRTTFSPGSRLVFPKGSSKSRRKFSTTWPDNRKKIPIVKPAPLRLGRGRRASFDYLTFGNFAPILPAKSLSSSTGRTRLKGRAVLVTGATQGIGLAIAVGAAREGAEAVVIASRDPHKAPPAIAAVEAAGAPCAFVEADLAEPHAPDIIFDFAVK